MKNQLLNYLKKVDTYKGSAIVAGYVVLFRVLFGQEQTATWITAILNTLGVTVQ